VLLGLSSSFLLNQSDFAHVRMADLRIVQKDEIAVVRSMRSRIARKRDVCLALLPDCGAPLDARQWRA
jgi:hypothetical protein